MERKNKSGFTLIELLVVVLIVGILAAVALPQYTTAVEKARAAEALSLMNAVAGSIERYRFQKDAWPAANNFNKLDIEVPYQSASNYYGGKNFTITFSSSSNTCTISAARRDLSGTDTYTLKTVLTDVDNDTITAVRSCTYSGSGKGEEYCNAITNGHNTNF